MKNRLQLTYLLTSYSLSRFISPSVMLSTRGRVKELFSVCVHLMFQVQSADEMLRKKQKQEAVVTAELSRIKKMAATESGQFHDDPQKRKTEEVDERKKEFGANQGKYEKQEALVRWREEDAAEKFLFHGSQSRPITKSKRFSNEVFGMAVKV